MCHNSVNKEVIKACYCPMHLWKLRLLDSNNLLYKEILSPQARRRGVHEDKSHKLHSQLTAARLGVGVAFIIQSTKLAIRKIHGPQKLPAIR